MTTNKPVAVVVGATSKWQGDGRHTKTVYGHALPDGDLPIGIRWGVGGALAQRFAAEGYHVVLTTRSAANASGLREAIVAGGGESSVVELDLVSDDSVVNAFARIRSDLGDPEVVVYNAGYTEGRDLPPDRELLEHVPTSMFDTAVQVAVRGPFLVAKAVLPAMRERGRGSLFFSNNAYSIRGRKRKTGESLYYPRTMMRSLSQVLTEEYSPHGIHVANVIIDGYIDSPGTRSLAAAQADPSILVDPRKIADAFWYLHAQDRSVWTHEIQLTPHASPVTF